LGYVTIGSYENGLAGWQIALICGGACLLFIVASIIYMVRKQKKKRQLLLLNQYDKIENTQPIVQPYFSPVNPINNQVYPNQGYSNQGVANNNRGFNQGVSQGYAYPGNSLNSNTNTHPYSNNVYVTPNSNPYGAVNNNNNNYFSNNLPIPQ
jgi:hypothetical protein